MMIVLNYFVLNVLFSTHLLFVVTFLGWDFLRYSGDSWLLTFLISAFFFNVISGFTEASFFFFFSVIVEGFGFVEVEGFGFVEVEGFGSVEVESFGSVEDFFFCFFEVVRSFFKHFVVTITVTVMLLIYFIDKPLFYYCFFFFFWQIS